MPEDVTAPPVPEPVMTEPSTTEAVTTASNEGEKAVPHAEPHPPQTLQVKASDFSTILNEKSKDRATRIREVLSSVHAQDSTFLNDSERFAPLAKELAAALDVSSSLVRKCKAEVLHIVDKETNPEPEFPDKPAGAPAAPVTSTTPQQQDQPASSGGGAPLGAIGGALGGAAAATASPEAVQEAVKWSAQHVNFLFRFSFRMVNKFVKEWDLLTEEEEKDLGKLLPPIFDKLFPTTGDQQNYVMLTVALAAVFGPRVFKVMDARKSKNKKEATTAPPAQASGPEAKV